MEKSRAGKPSRQLKAIVRSVFVCMPVYYEVKPDNLTVLDEILFFPIFRRNQSAATSIQAQHQYTVCLRRCGPFRRICMILFTANK